MYHVSGISQEGPGLVVPVHPVPFEHEGRESKAIAIQLLIGATESLATRVVVRSASGAHSGRGLGGSEVLKVAVTQGSLEVQDGLE